jgi:Tol biopolymer transport system component
MAHRRQAMSLLAGTRLGPYEILTPLGAGGMGEVYKARDTRLDRSVAIKVLPPHRSSSPEARQRFEQEARTVSRLSHPHICALFDVGRQGEDDFLVMELLEGETLQDRLRRGPLPLDQALRCGVEIARALHAAHRQAIVHRDLKPGNVMLTRSGVKLLDFGLAKAITPLVGGSDGDDLETAQAAPDLTREGTLLGTLPYMAPEQIEGRAADARTDIFALGAVLYEMATGRKAFAESTQAALAAAILTGEPKAMSSLLPATPPALDRLVRTCLAKDPDARWQTAHDVGLQLAAIAEDGSLAPAAVAARPASRLRRLVPWALTALAVAVALGAVLRPRFSPVALPRTIRFSVAPPPGQTFLESVETVPLSLSPDGSQLAFVARDPAGVTRLWLRPLSAMEARPLDGTEGALSSLWSPDGRSLAFFAAGKLKRLDLPGGPALPLCDVRPGVGFQGAWGRDGQILFASAEGEAIYRVSTAGGEPVVAVKVDPSRGDARINWPTFLPDGQRFFYVARRRDGGGQLMLGQAGQPSRAVMPVVSSVEYVDPGYLVFVREGTLLGQRLDLASGRVVGEPFSIAEPVRYFLSSAWAAFTASPNGVLAYESSDDRSRLAWIDKSGRELGSVGVAAGNNRVRISPDGRKVLFDRAQPGVGSPDLWTAELGRGTETRLTFDRQAELAGVWTPDGGAVVFSAGSGGPPHLFRKDFATGVEEELLPSGPLQFVQDLSPDGKTVVFQQRTERGDSDLFALPLTGERKPSPILRSPFDEWDAAFSPDGRLLAFVSNASGRPELYLTPFPGAGARLRVSTGGLRAIPSRPGSLRSVVWSRDGREIFYVSADRELVAVPVRNRGTLEVGTPVTLFAVKGHAWISFDVSADGRFLAVVPEVVATEQPLTVVLNWPAELVR